MAKIRPISLHGIPYYLVEWGDDFVMFYSEDAATMFLVIDLEEV